MRLQITGVPARLHSPPSQERGGGGGKGGGGTIPMRPVIPFRGGVRQKAPFARTTTFARLSSIPGSLGASTWYVGRTKDHVNPYQCLPQAGSQAQVVPRTLGYPMTHHIPQGHPAPISRLLHEVPTVDKRICIGIVRDQDGWGLVSRMPGRFVGSRWAHLQHDPTTCHDLATSSSHSTSVTNRVGQLTFVYT